MSFRSGATFSDLRPREASDCISFALARNALRNNCLDARLQERRDLAVTSNLSECVIYVSRMSMPYWAFMCLRFQIYKSVRKPLQSSTVTAPFVRST